MPASSAIRYHKVHKSEDILAPLVRSVQDESIRGLTWQVRYAKKSEIWEARYIVAPSDIRYETYVMKSSGKSDFIRIYYKAPGLPPKARPKLIASVRSFELAALCAEVHLRRTVNRRRKEAAEGNGENE